MAFLGCHARQVNEYALPHGYASKIAVLRGFWSIVLAESGANVAASRSFPNAFPRLERGLRLEFFPFCGMLRP